jgi:hypothetical protein
MSARRYGDDEVREIFRRATEGDVDPRAVPADQGGLTLEELQRIGAEVGIAPTRVMRAAMSLQALGQGGTVRRSFGLPFGVSRVVDLPRAPTDREWELLVSECRTMFEARGEMTTNGGMREWSNGNLHIAVEPTANGHQLRLSTKKDEVRVLNMLSLLFAVMATVMGITVAASGKVEKTFPVVMMFGGFAMASYAINLFRVPQWARTRERQMAALAERAVRLLSG